MPKNQYLLATLLLVSTTAAWSFPTTARLTQAPEFRSEGQEIVIHTDKGTITASTGPDGVGIYQPFVNRQAKRGECFAFETESETEVEFSRAVDKSLARSVKPAQCGKR
jgi:hypothetical protein